MQSLGQPGYCLAVALDSLPALHGGEVDLFCHFLLLCLPHAGYGPWLEPRQVGRGWVE